jgi:hypothetical protein
MKVSIFGLSPTLEIEQTKVLLEKELAWWYQENDRGKKLTPISVSLHSTRLFWNQSGPDLFFIVKEPGRYDVSEIVDFLMSSLFPNGIHGRLCVQWSDTVH